MKLKILAVLLALVLVVGCFTAGITRLDASRHQEDKALLEDVLRRTAVACYASEGFYPPDVAYMQEHYGLRYDDTRFSVHYDRYASNLMPDITVTD